MNTAEQSMIERVSRSMLAASRPNANPDELTPAPRGMMGLIPKWQLYEPLARAAIEALREPGPVMRKVMTFEAAERDWPAAIDAILNEETVT